MRIKSGLAASPARYYQFAFGSKIYNITGYRDTIITQQNFAELDLDSPLIDSIGKGNILRAGFLINSPGAVTTRISLLRATGHDFVDIGTGGYADTRIPNDLYGPPINNPVQSHEVVETNKARVYYMTTDQDGNFRVGSALTVNQAQGSVSISVPLDISNLSSISLRRDLGPPINEFSVDNTMISEADYKVPTEQAVANYINRRLGLDRNGLIYAGSPLGPQFLDLRGLLTMKGTLNMGLHNISNLSTPRVGQSADASTKAYTDTKISLDGTFATDTDGLTHIPGQGEMAGPLQLYQDPNAFTVSLFTQALAPSLDLILSPADIGLISTKSQISGINIPAGTTVTGIDYPNNTIRLSQSIIGNIPSLSSLFINPVKQAVTKRYVDSKNQLNQLSDVLLTNATNQDLLMFGNTISVNTSSNPLVYNAGTQVVNVKNDTSVILNTTTSSGGGSDITITRNTNTATFKLVGGKGSNNPITDYHINNDAQIQQSKLFLNTATTSLTAPTGGQRAQQLSLGSAQFDAIMFSANNGWITLSTATSTSTGILPEKMSWIPANGGLLGSTVVSTSTPATYVSSASVQTWLQNLSSPWVFSSNLNPNTDIAESLGTPASRWNALYANSAVFNSGITLNTTATIKTDQLIANVFTSTLALTVGANLVASKFTASLFTNSNALTIGATTGTVTINNPTIISPQSAVSLFASVSTLTISSNILASQPTASLFTNSNVLSIGATSGTLTVGNPTVVGTQATQNVFNTVATTVNAFGAATSLNLGASTGATAINNNLSVSGNTTFAGTVTFNGTATYVLSTNTFYTDNIQELHTPPGGVTIPWTIDDGKDIGFRFHYYNGGDLNAALVLAHDTRYLEWYSSGTENASGNFTPATYGTFKTGVIKLASGTAATGAANATGDLQVAGGVGIGGDLFVGATTNLAGNVAVNTNKFTVNATTGAIVAAGSITASGALTGTSLNGSGSGITAGTIQNSSLANFSVQVLTGAGLSGGGTVNLGNSLSLQNTGVISIQGTQNQVLVNSGFGTNISGSGIVLSLPQAIGTGNSPTFVGLTLTGALTAATISAGTQFNGPGTGLTGTAASLTAGTATIANSLNTANSYTMAGLLVNGAINATGDITAFYTSDARLKTNINVLENSLTKINALKGVTFNWNDVAISQGKSATIQEAGVIAQDVQSVLPEAVTQRDNGYLAVRYEKLVPLLIEAIKELSAEVEALKKRLA